MSTKIKNQPAIARRKSLRKREQRMNGVPVVVAKIRGEYYPARRRPTEKTTWVGNRYRVLTGVEKQTTIAQFQPTFRAGAAVRHTILNKTGMLMNHVAGGKWTVRWDGARVNAGPYVERNLTVV